MKAEAVCLCKCLHMSLAPHPVRSSPSLARHGLSYVLLPTAKQCLSCVCQCVCVGVCVCVSALLWLWPSPEVAIFVFLLSSFAYNGTVKVHKMSWRASTGSAVRFPGIVACSCRPHSPPSHSFACPTAASSFARSN